MPTRPWRVDASHLLLEDAHCRIEADDVETPDGRRFRFARVHTRGFAKVLPITADGHVLFVRQWRQAPLRATLELPAGGLEPNEEPIAAARRELAEEALVEAADLLLLGRFLSSPGRMDEAGWLFLATGCQPLLGAHQDEPTEVVAVPLDEAYAAIGGVVDGASCALALLLARPHLGR